MTDSLDIRPIGYVRGGRELPRDDDWGSVRAEIELDEAEFSPEALFGLSDFSHLEVVFFFHGVSAGKVEKGARHPRENPDWPLVGIFAQRGRSRPNRLGVCVCGILKVEGLKISVEGLDAIDGTPVLDLKPVMREFLPRGEVKQPDWADELMRSYW
jgi:tRNA-Thr(GGU) m(6)t(6)A37 methyltransferase TsaA